MATELGTYMVALSTSAKGISNEIRNQIGAPADAEAGKSGKRMGGILSSSLGKAIALTGGGLAIGGMFKSGLSAATDFEAGMNEVFTLLPGISGDAMGSMKGQVKDFSREFGVLPDEVVPALYQSLSAGVPQDNVFQFLETAQKAAKGGVTDLTTAVDGISSVVNAYGADMMDAGKASDLMFTAVKLGKTNFSELSASLSQVTPIAASLGVGFEDVSASIAVLTAKGVPTAQATTQMKSAFAELAKEGSVASDAFTQLSGKSFTDFIAGGGNVQEAFQMMSDGADANGQSVAEMFGSIEAAQAVMALTSDGGTQFADVLGQMGNSAGATEAAFAQMDTGFQAAWSKIKANVMVGLMSLAEKVLPSLTSASEWVVANMDGIGSVMSKIGSAVSAAASVLVSFGSAVATGLGWLIDNKPVLIGAITGVVAGLAVWGAAAAAAALANFTLSASMIAVAAPFIAIGVAIAAVVAALVWAYQNVEWFRNGVDAVRAWMVDTLWPAVQMVWSGIVSAITTAITTAGAVVQTVATALQAFWAAWGQQIMAVATFAWNYISTQITNVMGIIRGVIKVVTSLIKGDWAGAWNGIKLIATNAANYLKTFLSAAWTVIRAVASAAWAALKASISTQINAARSAVTSAVNGAKSALTNAWNSAKSSTTSAWSAIQSAVSNKVSELLGKVRALPGQIVGALSGLAGQMRSVGTNMIEGLIGGIRAMAGRVASAARDVVKGAINAAKGALGIRSPSRVFAEMGRFSGEGLIVGTLAMVDRVAKAGEQLARSLVPAVPTLSAPRLAAAPIAPPGYRSVAGTPAGGDSPLIGVVNLTDGRDLHSELRRAQMLRGGR